MFDVFQSLKYINSCFTALRWMRLMLCLMSSGTWGKGTIRKPIKINLSIFFFENEKIATLTVLAWMCVQHHAHTNNQATLATFTYPWLIWICQLPCRHLRPLTNAYPSGCFFFFFSVLLAAPCCCLCSSKDRNSYLLAHVLVGCLS